VVEHLPSKLKTLGSIPELKRQSFIGELAPALGL
jgi:hypothetical protein